MDQESPGSKKYNILKSLLKQQQKNTIMVNKDKESYHEHLTPIQVKVLATKSNCEKELKSWELDYIKTHNLISPTHDIMISDKIPPVLLNKIKYARGLLKEWKISFL